MKSNFDDVVESGIFRLSKSENKYWNVFIKYDEKFRFIGRFMHTRRMPKKTMLDKAIQLKENFLKAKYD